MHIYRLFLGLIGESAAHRRWGGGFGGGNGSRGRRGGRTGSHISRTVSYVEGFALRQLRLRSRHHFRYRMLRDLKCFVHQSDPSKYVTSLPSLGIPHDAFHHVMYPARSLYVSLVVRARHVMVLQVSVKRTAPPHAITQPDDACTTHSVCCCRRS